MSDLHEQLADAEAQAARLRLQIAHGACADVGHDWRHIGGANAACDHAGGDCHCSVPVNECAKCGDCDYGDYAEAADVRRHCRELRSE